MQTLPTHSLLSNARTFTGAALRQLAKLLAVPSLLALALQVLALAGVWLSAVIVQSLVYQFIQPPFALDSTTLILGLVLLQALYASKLSTVFGMAVWWRWIHFLFPILLYAMTFAHIPNTVYVIGFLITLSMYWTTFKTQVPFYPSRPAVWQALLHIVEQQRSPRQAMRVIDIGSGLGDLSMHLANANPQDHIQGIEIAPLPWLISWLRAYGQRSSASFVLGNYQHLKFDEYDVVFAYLSPAAMPQLWQKATQEMRSGCLLVSLEFDIPGVAPTNIILPNATSPKLYLWRMP